MGAFRSVRWVVILIVLGFLVLGAWYGDKTELKKFTTIQHVKITGRYSHLSQNELVKATLPYVRDDFFGVDLSLLRERLLQFPWIDNVTISRIWPDTLVIHIQEQQAIAQWGEGALLNVRGEVFHPDHLNYGTELPQLEGPLEQSNQVYRQYQLWEKKLQQIGLHIAELHLNLHGSWWMQLKNGMQVILGQDDASKRLDQFVNIYPLVFGSRGSAVSRVDLRYTSGLAVNWRERLDDHGGLK